MSFRILPYRVRILLAIVLLVGPAESVWGQVPTPADPADAPTPTLAQRPSAVDPEPAAASAETAPAKSAVVTPPRREPTSPAAASSPAANPAKVPAGEAKAPAEPSGSAKTAPSNPAPSSPVVAAGPAGKALEVDAASFKGVQPGHATRDNLVRLWGKPIDEQKLKQGTAQSYRIEPFKQVRVTLVDDTVTSIVLYLDKPFAPEILAKQLQIDNVEAVDVVDDKGALLGQAFPERGVLFTIVTEGTSRHVAQIMLEPIDAQPFLLRAESKMARDYTASLADVDYALTIAPDSARAHQVRARILDSVGRLHEAFRAAEQAIALDSSDPDHRLAMVAVLLQTADFDRAREEIQRVLSSDKSSSLARARAYQLWGNCLAASSARDYPQAVKHHLEAIRLAEPLTSSPQVVLRRAAKHVMLEAHLAVAHDIAWGTWQQKSKVVPRWIQRASVLVDDLVTTEKEDDEVRLRLYEGALAAIAGIEEQPPDPSAWSKGAMQVNKQLAAQIQDPARQQQIEWHTGRAMADALEIEFVLGHQEKALYFGNLAIESLARATAAGQQLSTRDFLMGRLYYRMGAVYAIKRRDHRQAVDWYEKAVALLEHPVPPSAAADPGRQGDTFVSMAVSYWETGKHQEALRLTEQGVKLLEQAVESGTVEKTALVVPYGNLSSMHGQLGNEQKAKQLAELAAKYAGQTSQ